MVGESTEQQAARAEPAAPVATARATAAAAHAAAGLEAAPVCAAARRPGPGSTAHRPATARFRSSSRLYARHASTSSAGSRPVSHSSSPAAGRHAAASSSQRLAAAARGTACGGPFGADAADAAGSIPEAAPVHHRFHITQVSRPLQSRRPQIDSHCPVRTLGRASVATACSKARPLNPLSHTIAGRRAMHVCQRWRVCRSQGRARTVNILRAVLRPQTCGAAPKQWGTPAVMAHGTCFTQLPGRSAAEPRPSQGMQHRCLRPARGGARQASPSRRANAEAAVPFDVVPRRDDQLARPHVVTMRWR
jgi:hypothetical protein